MGGGSFSESNLSGAGSSSQLEEGRGRVEPIVTPFSIGKGGLDTQSAPHENEVIQSLGIAQPTSRLIDGPLASSATRHKDALSVLDANAGYLLDSREVQVSLNGLFGAQGDEQNCNKREKKKQNLCLFVGQRGSKACQECLGD